MEDSKKRYGEEYNMSRLEYLQNYNNILGGTNNRRLVQNPLVLFKNSLF